MAEMKKERKTLDKKENMGFTLVEMIIVFVILAIVAAIVVPITLSFIDKSHESDVKMKAKNIMNSVQTEFNQLGVNNELWYSITQEMAIILNKDRKNYGNGFFSIEGGNDIKNEFKSGFINISETVPTDNIFKRMENPDEVVMLYVGAGNAYYYEYTNEDDSERKKMYMAYVIVFKLKDDDNIYFYDGKEVTTKWPFSTPSLNSSITITDAENVKGRKAYGQNFILNSNNNTILQMYALRIDADKRCDYYWKEVIVPAVQSAQ